MFTTHNVELSEGVFTCPNQVKIVDHPVFIFTKEIIENHFPDKTYIGKKIMDIGCLEGGYTTEFARLGMNSVGLEARSTNISKCFEIKNKINIDNLNFVQDDAWNITKYSPFDIIFCCGLLYHLEYPKKYIDLLYSNCDLLILDTHYSVEDSNLHETSVRLSDISRHDGLIGRFYQEHLSDNKREDTPYASWGNDRSFWPLLSEIKRALSDSGFKNVYEYESFTRNSENKRATLVASK